MEIVDLVNSFPTRTSTTVVGRTIARGATLYKFQMLMNTATKMMVANGEMMTPIGPDIMQPGSVMLYQRRRSPRMATERKRPKGRR